MIIPHSWIAIDIVLSKAIHRFNLIHIKIQVFWWNQKANHQIYMELQGVQKIRIILKNENNVRRFTFPDFITWHKATVFKMVFHWHKNRHIHHGIIEIPEYIHTFMDIWFFTGVPRPLNRKRNLCEKWYWESWISTCTRIIWCISSSLFNW